MQSIYKLMNWQMTGICSVESLVIIVSIWWCNKWDLRAEVLVTPVQQRHREAVRMTPTPTTIHHPVLPWYVSYVPGTVTKQMVMINSGNFPESDKMNISNHFKFQTMSGPTPHSTSLHDDVIKWIFFPHYWPFTGGFPLQSPVTRSFNVFFELRTNNQDDGDLRRHRAHYAIIVLMYVCDCSIILIHILVHNDAYMYALL